MSWQCSRFLHNNSINRIQPMKTWATDSPFQLWFTILCICFTVVFLPTNLICLLLASQKLLIASENGLEGRDCRCWDFLKTLCTRSWFQLLECTGYATATGMRGVVALAGLCATVLVKQKYTVLAVMEDQSMGGQCASAKRMKVVGKSTNPGKRVFVSARIKLPCTSFLSQ